MARVEAQYNEGREAGENFKRVATALFRVPKNGRKQERQPKKATARKTSGKNGD